MIYIAFPLQQIEKDFKSKLPLKAQLVKPAQRIPRYELLLKRLLHHTPPEHADRAGLEAAIVSVHAVAIRINSVKESQAEHDLHSTVKRLENLLLTELSSNPDRAYVRHDNVVTPPRNEQCVLWLFTDLLIVSSAKRRTSGVVRRPATLMLHSHLGASDFIDNVKHKVYLRAALDSVYLSPLVKSNSVERRELEEDLSNIQSMRRTASNLHNENDNLNKTLIEMLRTTEEELAVVKSAARLDIYASLPEGKRHLTFIFTNGEKRQYWETTFKETKLQLATQWPSLKTSPTFENVLSIRRTRAGMHLTCASPSQNTADMWICQSDGHVTHVCLLAVNPEPIVTLNTTVPGCTSKVTCITLVPAIRDRPRGERLPSIKSGEYEHNDGYESEEDSETEKLKHSSRSTMWLGSADGRLHIFPSNENIRTTKRRRQTAVGDTAVNDLLVINPELLLVALSSGQVAAVHRTDETDVSITRASVGSQDEPVLKMVLTAHGDVWCATSSKVIILDPRNLLEQEEVAVSSDNKKILTLRTTGSYGMWIAFAYSSSLVLIHTLTRQVLAEINVSYAVSQRIKCLDDVIRQHKLACLRVTDILSTEGGELWIGTSAGVLLVLPCPILTPTARPLSSSPTPIALRRGHSGLVRFLASVKADDDRDLVVSGGDGFDDFERSGEEDGTKEEEIGTDDSLNHLILWSVKSNI